MQTTPPSTLEGQLPSPKRSMKNIVIAELKKQKPIVIPLIPMNFTWVMKLVLTYGFLGRLGELELDGGALGLTFANVTGYAVLMGLGAAMDPICGQAFGAKNYRLMHKSLLMTTIMLLVMSLPIGALWLNLDKILLKFGQDRDITKVAQIFVTWLLPDLAVTSFAWPLKSYLSTQGVVMPILVSSSVSLATHFPTNIWLSKAMKVRGVAIAKCITDLIEVLMLAVYVVWKEWRRDGGEAQQNATTDKRGGGWFDQSLREWARLLRLAGACCLALCLEWWCYELVMLLTGHLHNAKQMLAAYAILMNFDYVMWAFMMSLATTTSTRVSNELGAGDASAARTAALVSLGISIICGCTGGAIIIAVRGKWGMLFSHDREVVHHVTKMIVIMAAIEAINLPLYVSNSIARGTARPKLGMYAIIGGFYFLALPLGIVLGFKVRLGLSGLLLGIMVGAGTSLIVLLVLIGMTDWVKEAKKAQGLADAKSDGKGEGE